MIGVMTMNPDTHKSNIGTESETDFFEPLYRNTGNDDAWGGDMPSDEYVKNLRKGLIDDEII